MIEIPTFTDRMPFAFALAQAGWCSPDTYTHACSSIPAIAGVYLLVAYKLDFYPVVRKFVAYVGLSTKLSDRLDSKHEIWQQIKQDGFSQQRWFHPIKEFDLRNTERMLIRHFNPPYNINGRKRGIG